VYLINRCFESNDCTREFSTPRKLHDHLQHGHGYVFPARLKSTRRYNSKKHLYLRHRFNDSNTGSVIDLFACPCCTDHHIDLIDLSVHFRTVHYDYLP
ncbi:hypothetical protein BC941DRAFT_333866, partial [Chlamydoabsidia padenii]